MQKKQATWELINRSLLENVPVMLLYVLESKGSSPGRQGFFMAVTPSGDMHGSIGGGIMEHKFVEMAKDILLKQVTYLSVRKQVHDKMSTEQSGMICSGEQTILLYRVQPADLITVQHIIQARTGALLLSPAGIGYSRASVAEDGWTVRTAEDWQYQEILGYQQTLFIIGGGHCSLALSRIMRMMDFYVYVFDTRADLPTLLENEEAHEKIIVNDYSELRDLIPAGARNYVVVMTFGYRTDHIVLTSLSDKRFAYIGVLGSATKIRKMFDTYLAEGIDTSRVHAPIGIPIKSQTPEEIAVSIAAEIIQVKNTLPV
jgi:xanthine dehydrogenase accessory factor